MGVPEVPPTGQSEPESTTTRPVEGSEESATPGNEKPEALSDSGQSGQAPAAASDDGAGEYPTGLRLVLLAGASIMGVFLISLDQASNEIGFP